MEETTSLQSLSLFRQRIRRQPSKYNIFFRTKQKKTQPTRRSRRRKRRMGDDVEITENLRNVTFSSTIVHALIAEALTTLYPLFQGNSAYHNTYGITNNFPDHATSDTHLGLKSTQVRILTQVFMHRSETGSYSSFIETTCPRSEPTNSSTTILNLLNHKDSQGEYNWSLARLSEFLITHSDRVYANAIKDLVSKTSSTGANKLELWSFLDTPFLQDTPSVQNLFSCTEPETISP
ncbi:uncharacterized protein ACNLHF_014388 [Anomaloglossus baeobatrachus]|uniref:uncharacterized protein LOC142303234 n=1 Tax=Anomaloglossus baeobatrachus TaxID=238106 RepID=UPI003F4FE215